MAAKNENVEPSDGKKPEDKETENGVHVLDTTARITAKNPTGARIHEIEVKGQLQRLTFKPGVPRLMPRIIAAKFLRHEGFVCVDKNGDTIPWEGAPKQPDESQAGQKFTLADNQTVANLSELTNEALELRATVLPGGDDFITSPGVTRLDVVRFITDARRATKRANERAEAADPDTFVPEPLSELEMA